MSNRGEQQVDVPIYLSEIDIDDIKNFLEENYDPEDIFSEEKLLYSAQKNISLEDFAESTKNLKEMIDGNYEVTELFDESDILDYVSARYNPTDVFSKFELGLEK